MIVTTLFSVFVGEIVKDLYAQKASDAVLRTWANYTQGNHDVQTALKAAFVKTPGALALALVEESGLLPRLKFTSPKLSREFSETIDANYIKPFCGTDQRLERKLRKIAKAQCKALSKFFANYEFRSVSVEDVANLLYNIRFVTDPDIIRKQAQLTKTALKTALSQAKFDQDFVNFLLFPDDGNGVLYDGVVYHFEEEIKSNERVSNILAHFDRQQILGNSERARNNYADLTKQIAALQSQLAEHTQASDISNQLAALQARQQKLERFLAISERNAQVWQQVDTDLTGIRERFGEMSHALSEHFGTLQKWLDGEFDAVKATVADEGQKVREHVSQEVNNIARLVRQELQQFFSGQSDVNVEEIDFLAKPYALADHYEQIEPLGSGGLAAVYKMRRKFLKSIVAVKVLSSKHQHDPATIARFWAEGKIMGSLSGIPGHHFAKVREMGRSADGQYFLEMDFVEGNTLDALLQERGALPPEFVLRLLRQLALALGHAHDHHIIHRDIKPQNIIVSADGHLTLIDFGIAKRLDSDSLMTMDGAFYGTLYYAAPEQIDDAFGKISGRTDIYALGVLGYQLLTNQFPFEGTSFTQIGYAHCHKPLPDFSPSLKMPKNIAAFIVKCAQKRPEDRFQSMREVATAIDNILQEDAIEEYREYFSALLPDITEKKRQILERHRQRLGLNPETIAPLERELEKALARVQPDKAGTQPLPAKKVNQETRQKEQPLTPEHSTNSVSEPHTILLRNEPTTVPASERKAVFGLQNTNRPIEFITNAFEDRGETVFDHATGLLWQKAGLELSTSAEDTQAYIDRLNAEGFAGYHDWRLPTVPELISLLEPEQHGHGGFIHSLFEAKLRFCWSADRVSKISVWIVNFSNVNVQGMRLDTGTAKCSVRCVRSWS
jgi:serine/threonine protein kinase